MSSAHKVGYQRYVTVLELHISFEYVDHWSCTYGPQTKPMVEQAKRIGGISRLVAKFSNIRM
jgi:hypothetical protein